MEGFNDYNALSTFPDLKHLVQTGIFFTAPSTTALTFLIFGDQLLLPLRWEKEMVFPNTLFFPHTEQILDIMHLPSKWLQLTKNMIS